jgi:hypothetical protein
MAMVCLCHWTATSALHELNKFEFSTFIEMLKLTKFNNILTLVTNLSEFNCNSLTFSTKNGDTAIVDV